MTSTFGEHRISVTNSSHSDQITSDRSNFSINCYAQVDSLKSATGPSSYPQYGLSDVRGATNMASACCRKSSFIVVNGLTLICYILLAVIFLSIRAAEIVELRQQGRQGFLKVGKCMLILNKPCPDSEVNFFLYTQQHPEVPELVVIDGSNATNLTESSFNPNLPTKIIIHGYNSDMFLGALVEIKHQYFQKGKYNIIAVDWAALAPAPCYPIAVVNSRHVGTCVAQLVDRILELNSTDIHLIGFSLGAHVAGFAANNLKPYKLPRITGLDPAMPLFTFVGADSKLDASDAEFVDIMHTNAFIQGKVETSGHVDYFMNGGITQPGCWAEQRFFACNHHRAPLYFAESITSKTGFWGWPCESFLMYLLGQCPPKAPQILIGENVNKSARGFHLVITGSVSPFAVGEFNGSLVEILKNKSRLLKAAQFKVKNKPVNLSKYTNIKRGTKEKLRNDLSFYNNEVAYIEDDEIL